MFSRKTTLDRAHTDARGSDENTIASRENSWLKAFRANLRGNGRGTEGRLGLEGPHLVEEAVRSGIPLEAVLVGPAGDEHLKRIQATMNERNSGAPEPHILRTSEKLFASVAETETPQGIAALAKVPTWSFEDLLRGDVPLVVVLSGVQDPGNVGTIIRSAEAFGATGAIATRGAAYPFAPKVLRASAGSALRLPLLAGISTPVALAQLRVSGLTTFATSSRQISDRQAISPAEAYLRKPAAILIGSEGSGLLPEIVQSADVSVLIPVVNEVESLNAAVAASVLLYEAARQRAKGNQT